MELSSMRRTIGLALAAILLAAPALAGQHDHDQDQPREKKICRSEQMTGSIMPKRTCHTAAQWATIDKQNKEDARTTLDRARSSSATLDR